MTGFVARRILLAGPTLLGVSFLAFLTLSVLPGDPLAAGAGAPLSAEAESRLRQELRLDRPVLVRYAEWLAGAAQGDLGRSIHTGRPVAGIVADAAPWTIALNLSALAAIYGLALPLGLLQARRPRSAWARLSEGGLLLASVIPPFVAALLLQGLFAVRLGWLPLSGTGETGTGLAAPGGRMAHLVLPALCLALAGWAFATRYARGAFAEAVPASALAAARARGLRGPDLLRHFALLLALPLVWLLGGIVPALLSGSVIVEEAFAWPGLGRLMVQAVLGRDTPLAMALLLLSAAAVLTAQLAIDLLQPALDPRLRTTGDVPRDAGARD